MKAIGLIYNINHVSSQNAVEFAKALGLTAVQILKTNDARAEDVRIIWDSKPSESSIFDRVFGRSF